MSMWSDRLMLEEGVDGTYIVSQAKEKDLVELSQLVNSAYRGDSSRVGWTTEADFLGGQRTDPDVLRTQIVPPGTILCLREKSDGPILGCVFLERREDHAYLGMLTIKPNLQAKGLGRILLESAEHEIKSWKLARVVLRVVQLRDSLIDWYVRRGYTRTGETEQFPYGDEKFGVPQRDDLHFVVFEKFLL